MFMAVATALATFAWVVIVWNTDPFETGITGFWMFYLTLLFMTLVGARTILGSLYRVHILKRKDVLIREVGISFRHAMPAMAGIAALVLSAQGRSCTGGHS